MSSCNCSCEDSDYEGPDLFEEQIRTARKEYICCECSEPIKPKSKYEWAHGLWDGGFDTYRTCIPCRNIRNEYCPCGFGYGGLRYTLKECLDIDYMDPNWEPRSYVR